VEHFVQNIILVILDQENTLSEKPKEQRPVLKKFSLVNKSSFAKKFRLFRNWKKE
jgi:hypothetical protein